MLSGGHVYSSLARVPGQEGEQVGGQAKCHYQDLLQALAGSGPTVSGAVRCHCHSGPNPSQTQGDTWPAVVAI